jgi:hypothetical protein
MVGLVTLLHMSDVVETGTSPGGCRFRRAKHEICKFA